MRTKIFLLVCILITAHFSACTHNSILNENTRDLKFSEVTSDYNFSDRNNYGCTKIDLSVLEHILQKGTAVSHRTVHDDYAITGCSLAGEILINGKKNTFDYDYGGIMYFSDGLILACGKNCCSDNYPNCSWNEKE